MKLNKKLGLFLITVVTLPMLGLFNSSHATEAVLPPLIAAQKMAYDTFPDIIAKYNPTMIQQVNDNEDRIKVVKIPLEPFALKAGEAKEIEIPADIARIIFTFERLTVYGSGFKNMGPIEVIWPDEGNVGKVHAGWFSDTAYQIKDDNFPIDHLEELARGDEAYTGYKLRFNGPVEVKELNVFKENGVSMVMDTTAWEVIGGDKEILDGLSIDVDATKRLSLEGITEFEDDKFKRLYTNPVTGADGYKVAEYFVPKGFSPGRQIVKLAPTFEIGYSANEPKLVEDATRPGHADLTFFDNYRKQDIIDINNMDKYYSSDLEYVICFDNWPSWTYEGKDIGRGTPDVEHFDGAAELIAEYVSAYDDRMDGRGPTYIEVKNESTLVSEWSHHTNAEQGYGWDVLADFHNMVAKAVHEKSPDTQVGGASAAWMALDNAGFTPAREHMKFMDDTKNDLDFYSYHFYESKDLILNETVENYGGYLTGRLEANLDLLHNHMVLTDNIKPILITETGTLHSGPSDSDYWINLKNHNSYMIRYMNRADEFDMVTQFILPAIWWNKEDPKAIWLYGENGQLIPTQEEGLSKTKYFIEMWDEYTGELLPVKTNDVNNNVYAHSAQDGNVIYVAMTNMNPQRAYIDLNLNLKDEQIETIERTTMYLDLGKLHFVDNEKLDSLEDIFMHVEETSIIKITLNEAPEITDVLHKNTFYGDRMLQPTGATPAQFFIDIPADNIASTTNSILRVSLGRTDGFNVPINVTINGYALEAYDLSYSDKVGNFFTYIDFEIPTDILQEKNELAISVNQEDGHISTVALINHAQ
ncbi:hypothetical protein AN641_09390 [Candidatus Epulonipiscioides gigas]|nr:hypothetical protein AN641_09390 [Epulopiscium sp. SCG-C07WGA-EpuloA2]